MSNRITLHQLRTMSPDEASRIPVDQLALLLEDLAELKADAKALGDLLNDALHARYGDQAAILRRAEGKNTGRVRIGDADFEVVADLPKKVEWHQERLAEAVETVRGWGEDPAHYVTTELRVPEARYAAWPPRIRSVFEPARTVAAGRPTYSLQPKDSAK
jgi:hypothetical protein